jgi:uncharacterized protein
VIRLSNLSFKEISFRNEVQGINLAGMFLAPQGEGPFPAAVFIHGSGTSRRENSWYLTLAAHLQENGVLVLLPDKRGSEKSEGDWHSSSFEDLATDTLAAVDFLKNQETAEISRIGIVGLSQGGHLAPMVAVRSQDIAFLVDVVGATLPMHEVLHYEEIHNLREMGFPPRVSNLIAYLTTLFLRKISQKDFWDAVGNFDPLPYWQEVSVPAMVMLGREDTNVPSLRSKARLELIKKDNIQIRIYEGSGHALQDPEGSGIHWREDALTDIVDFISRTADRINC